MTENEFLHRLAEALNTGDVGDLHFLQSWNDGLLQDEESHQARAAVIIAALNAAYELEQA